ncbi:MAG TPA: flagellar basal body P-ring protein FlgI, partial [Caulifigura sp.]|nr:flagellar basal body P-ring protein FlgI [Caulifigura sp.]
KQRRRQQDAAALTGGILLSTPLLGLDGNVYAVADGPVSVDSFVASGQAATTTKNHPTAGRITEGGVIEADVCTTLTKDGLARLLIRQPDFETSARMAAAINKWTPQMARAIDPAVIELNLRAVPKEEITQVLGQIGMLTVEPDSKAKVVVNERTGTIVVGRNVKLSNVLITHGNLAISTKESPEVSQPAPFSEGETTVVPRTDVSAVEEDRPIHVLPETTTVEDLATALNALGIPPRDLGVIFQQLKDAGALHAELEFK